jgi:hypothetical protein
MYRASDCDQIGFGVRWADAINADGRYRNSFDEKISGSTFKKPLMAVRIISINDQIAPRVVESLNQTGPFV